MTEAEFIAALRGLPLHAGARGLIDDVAMLDAAPLVVSTDTLVEGVHFLGGDPPADVAWKLVATNLSDLAAKGARPEGLTLNYALSDGAWDAAFVAGLAEALERFGCPLIGGDTVALPPGAPRVLAATAFGSDAASPARGGAAAGDALWVTGTIGDAGAGLAIARGGGGPATLLKAYRRPHPRLREGRQLAGKVAAMMDVSDGLLIDATRMAAASGVAVEVDLAAVPLSPAYRSHAGDGRAARLAAVTAGDDYQLLFAWRGDAPPPVAATAIGGFAKGSGLKLRDGDERLAAPRRLGFQHG